jgi:hypothetical protein
MNNSLYNIPNDGTSISIPFVLTQSLTSISAISDRDNQAFVPSVSCQGNNYLAGNICTLTVWISNTGDGDTISGNISVYADTLLGGTDIIANGMNGIMGFDNFIMGTTGYLFGVPITVLQNQTGNLVTSGMNVVINPSDGLVGNAQTVTLLNNGSATITGITVTGITPVVISSNGCSSLAANASCTFNVNVTSSTSGQSSVVVTYNNGASSGNTLGSLSFNVIYIAAVPGPAMTMTSGQGNLLNVAINTIQYYNIKVNNTGNVTLSSITFSDPSTAGTGTGAAFSWDTTSTCVTNGSQSLVAGGSCTLVLKYAPTVVTAPTTITIRQTAIWFDQGGNQQSYANANLTISYSAIDGDAFLYITPNYVSFAIRADGVDTVAQTFTVQNSGLQSTIVDAVNIPAVTAFVRTGGTCTAGVTSLAPSATCTIIVLYGTTTSTVTNVTESITVAYKPNLGYTNPITTFTNLVFNASTAAYVTISNIVVTNSTSGNGLVATPYLFTNSPATGTQINFVVTYANTGPANATNFNVALSNQPVGYVVVVGANTTCGYGSTVTTLLATTGTCSVEFKAVNATGLYNSYALSGAINVNIPGYSYTDTNTGLNTMQFPVWAGNYASGNTIYATANLLATVTTTPPTWATAHAGGVNNYTFTGVASDGAIITIPASQLIGFTVGGGGTCTIASNTCTIPITNPAGFPASTNYFGYIVSPAGQAPNGIIQQASFILNSQGLIWTKQVGASGGSALGRGVSVDSSGNSYVAGYTTVAISGQTKKGATDYFIAKYNTSGTLLWTNQVGASGGGTSGYGVSVDSSGNSYVTGYTNVGISGQTKKGATDYFIAKYNTSGTLLWTKQVGASNGSTSGYGVSVDSIGNSYVAGYTSVGISDQNQQGTNDYFIAKYF